MTSSAPGFRSVHIERIARVAALATLAGCGGGDAAVAPPAGPAPAPATASASTDVAAVTCEGGLVFDAPKSWRREPVAAGGMRRAHLRLPAAAGATDDAELIAFYFGAGQGGSVEANLQRWYGQFQRPDGRAPAEAATVATRTVNGLRVTTVDLAGTYVAAVTPGAQERHHKADYRLLAAIVETTDGPWFLKGIAPAATADAEAANFAALVASVRRGP